MTWPRRALTLLAAAFFIFSAPVSARTEAELRACIKANLPQQSFRQDIRLDVRDRSGARKLISGTWYWQRLPQGQAGLLRLSLPADIAGTAYLTREIKGKGEFYVYVPALKKVRKLEGAGAEQALFDSGLSAFDLAFLLRGLSQGQLQRSGALNSQGRAAESWRYTPPDDPNILYDRVDLLMDNQWCLPLEAKLFGGVPWKTLSLDRRAVIQREGRWLPRRFHAEDLREGSKTTLELFNDSFNPDLSPSLFDPRKFHLKH